MASGSKHRSRLWLISPLSPCFLIYAVETPLQLIPASPSIPMYETCTTPEEFRVLAAGISGRMDPQRNHSGMCANRSL